MKSNHGTGDYLFAEHLPQVYDRLHQLAKHYLSRRGDRALQPTDLVHEAYLRLTDTTVDQQGAGATDGDELFAAGSRIMRRILARDSRRRRQVRRGEAMARDPQPVAFSDPTELLNLTTALDRLAREDRRRAWIVKLRSCFGLENHEIAALLGVAPHTVEEEWRAACSWLRNDLNLGDGR